MDSSSALPSAWVQTQAMDTASLDSSLKDTLDKWSHCTTHFWDVPTDWEGHFPVNSTQGSPEVCDMAFSTPTLPWKLLFIIIRYLTPVCSHWGRANFTWWQSREDAVSVYYCMQFIRNFIFPLEILPCSPKAQQAQKKSWIYQQNNWQLPHSQRICLQMEIVELNQLHTSWNIFTAAICSRGENYIFLKISLKIITIIVPLAEFRDLCQCSLKALGFWCVSWFWFGWVFLV